MLVSIYVSNFAIIDEVKIDFDRNLNVITGETGAGKSILVGALNFALGERANTNSIKNKEEKCIVELEFDLSFYDLKSLFENNDLEYSDITFIRREILPSGKSRSFVNDSPCTQTTLNLLSSYLVDIHSQHDSLVLKNNDYQLKIIDNYLQNLDKIQDLSSNYFKMIELKKKYKELLNQETQNSKDLEYLNHQTQEMSTYDFELWNFKELESKMNLFENSIEIKNILKSISHKYFHDDLNVISVLNDFTYQIKKQEKYSSKISELNISLYENIESLNSTILEIEKLEESFDFDVEEMNEIKTKIDFVNNLILKYRLKSFEELIEYKQNISFKLNIVTNSSENLLKIKEELLLLYTSVLTKSEIISKERRTVFELIENTVLEYLSELGMADSKFKIWIDSSKDNLSSTGIDKVKFLFSANSGVEPKELKDSISGGEMSRFMLAIKSMIAKKIKLPTIIFDEIDTGVSGQIAAKVAKILLELSKNIQIITITHLPQIAAKGDSHLFIFKTNKNGNTVSSIKKLNNTERIEEIAKMISSDTISNNALATAEEMLIK